MAENSSIEWTDHTFNPWHGCVKVSQGCKFCYADAQDRRFGESHWGPNAPRKMMGEAYWRQPERWNRDAAARGVRARVFCASMADVFEQLPGTHISFTLVEYARFLLWKLIEATPHLDWLLLTKRPENIREMVPLKWVDIKDSVWPANVWIGTSVEDQAAASERIPHLLQVPARVRFLSCEPLLGPVHLDEYWRDTPGLYNPSGAFGQSDTWDTWLDGGINWVIVGGESGPSARPMHPGWARQLRDQCEAHEVPFFFKQWGEWLPGDQKRADGTDAHLHQAAVEAFGGKADLPQGWADGSRSHRVGKKAAGRLLDGRVWDEMPVVDEMPETVEGGQTQ